MDAILGTVPARDAGVGRPGPSGSGRGVPRAALRYSGAAQGQAERARGGDAVAMEDWRNDGAMLADIRRDMVRFALLQLRDSQAAEDAVQEALLAAFDGAERFAGRAALKTWVFSILRNKIVDAIRHRTRMINASALGTEGEALDETFEALFDGRAHWRPEVAPVPWARPDEALEQQQFWEVFDACLDHLPENTARIFMMREFLGLETDEICGELGISAGNCHVILHRARHSLRRCLDGGWFAAGGAG